MRKPLVALSLMTGTLDRVASREGDACLPSADDCIDARESDEIRERVTQAVECEALRDARAVLDCEARIAFEQLLRELRPFARAP
jgi:hypothetical protein